MVKRSAQRLWVHFRADSLFQNSVYLMLGTAIQAALGFVFWIITSHLYSSDDVGIATTLVSTITLISTLGMLGLNTTLIRYLPSSKNRGSDIGFAVIMTSLTSLFLALLYVIGLHTLSPKLAAYPSQMWLWVLLVAGSVAVGLSTLSDSLFISLRKAKFVALTSAVFSFIKLGFVLAAISLKAYGPFLAQILGYLGALVASLFVQKRYLSIRYSWVLQRDMLKKIRAFAMGSYLVSLANSLPGLLLPMVILNYLGASSVAYFYVALMVANVLFIIPLATTQAQFAEGATEPEQMMKHLRDASRLIGLLMIPAIAIILVCAPLIMSMFGSGYGAGGAAILRLLALSGLPVSVNYILSTVLRIKNMVKPLVFISIITTVATFFGAYSLIGYGLTGIGIGWNIGEGLTTLLLLVVAVKVLRPNTTALVAR